MDAGPDSPEPGIGAERARMSSRERLIDELQEIDRRLLIGPGGATITDDLVRPLRDAGQR